MPPMRKTENLTTELQELKLNTALCKGANRIKAAGQTGKQKLKAVKAENDTLKRNEN
ncbi:hypothetical protein PO124_18410 [Bacillus licheniformis]|nr:hypothetical protein [Bacillus licheniformis]